jgi:peptide/nickel transport system permease protein
MNRHVERTLKHIARIVSLLILAALGTIALTRYSPGYFADDHELDPEHADAARIQLQTQESRQGNLIALSAGLLRGWVHGDFGRSKQFDVPVTELIRPRLRVTAKLLLFAVGSGWFIATLLAVPLGLRRLAHGEAFITAITVCLLAVPIGALATACLLAGCGGPVAVLTTLIAIRDFRFVYRLVRNCRMGMHLTCARAQGICRSRIAFVYLLPTLSRELLAIGVISIITALSAIVPVEVIFDVPGLGQLAWSAAMNRDLPVLLGVTLIMAAAVGLVTAMAKSNLPDVAI